MLIEVNSIPFPLSDPDDMWVAMSPTLSLREVREELIEFLCSWIDDQITVDEDGNAHGWIAPYRQIVESVYMGAIRPDHEVEDWWWECKREDEGALPAWIFKI